jgi:hypothetical protein
LKQTKCNYSFDIDKQLAVSKNKVALRDVQANYNKITAEDLVKDENINWNSFLNNLVLKLIQ